MTVTDPALPLTRTEVARPPHSPTPVRARTVTERKVPIEEYARSIVATGTEAVQACAVLGIRPS